MTLPYDFGCTAGNRYGKPLRINALQKAITENVFLEQNSQERGRAQPEIQHSGSLPHPERASAIYRLYIEAPSLLIQMNMGFVRNGKGCKKLGEVSAIHYDRGLRKLVP